MPVDMVVKNGKLVTSAGVVEGGVAIDKGEIVGIAKDVNLPKADETIDASGNPVFPGAIDPHVHLRAKAYPFEHNCLTESQSAVTGGITTIIHYLTEDQSLFNVFEEKREAVEKKSLVDMAFHVMLFNDMQLEETPQYREKLGITSFKFMMGYTGEIAKQIGIMEIDDGILYRGLEIIRDVPGGVPIVHAEDGYLAEMFTKKMESTGRQDLEAWTDARPSICEEEGIRRSLFFAMRASSPIYIAHISSKEGLEAVQEGKSKYPPIYAETSACYLSLTKELKMGSYGKVNPPLREREDTERLWRGMREGLIDTVGSDHVAHTRETKGSELWSSPPGLTGIAVIMPVLISEGVNKNRIPIEKVVEVCCENPARIFGLYPLKGSMQPGADADLVIVDLKKRQRVTPEVLNSISDYTPYEGMEFRGWPVSTIVGGEEAMRDGEIYGRPGKAKYLPR